MTPAEIRSARLALGLTQKQLAPLLGYSHHTQVSVIERGAAKAGDAVVLLLVAYLDGYRPDDWPV